jgi:histone H3/H4
MTANFDDIKTHFPAARIKKLMQSDEDIGKVAQATPVVVGRALEFFLASLVQAAAEEAKSAGIKRVTAQHVKNAIKTNDSFDFLVDSVCNDEKSKDE